MCQNRYNILNLRRDTCGLPRIMLRLNWPGGQINCVHGSNLKKPNIIVIIATGRTENKNSMDGTEIVYRKKLEAVARETNLKL